MLVSARLTVVALLLAFGGCRTPEVDDRAEAARSVEEPAPVQAAIAITIDDLPWIGPVHPGETPVDATERLLTALRRHDAHAVGFVNCDRTNPRDPILQRWLEAGMRLGNHTAGHLDLNSADLRQWLDGARRCDTFLRELTGDSTILFRYPFLHQGPTPERREAARELLDELGSVNAHVTVDNSDWILAAAYGEAIRAGNQALQQEIGAAFLEHIMEAVRHYQEVAQRKVGRDVPHILLLHANPLVADHLDALLERLQEEGFRFVSTTEALRDPVYRETDDYVGPGGLSWLYRIEPATPEYAAWDDEQAAALNARFRE